MALTRSFRDTVVTRAQHDVEFRAALIEEAIQAFLDGDLEDARSILRDCINATIGFHRLSEVTHTPVKSLMRMVGPRGNPSAGNLAAVLRAVQQDAGVRALVEVASTVPGGCVTADAT